MLDKPLARTYHSPRRSEQPSRSSQGRGDRRAVAPDGASSRTSRSRPTTGSHQIGEPSMLVPPSDLPALRGPLQMKDAWTSVLEFVRARTKPQQFDTWFRSLRCLALDATTAIVGTPNDFYRKWMENHYVG